MEADIKGPKNTGKDPPETCNLYMFPLYCSKSAKQTVNVLHLRHNGKHSLPCFQSTKNSAAGKHKNSQQWRDQEGLAVDKTQADWNLKRLTFHIVIHPSRWRTVKNALRMDRRQKRMDKTRISKKTT